MTLFTEVIRQRSIVEKPAFFDIHRIILHSEVGCVCVRTPSSWGGALFRSPLGPALALLVWLSSCALHVAVEHVDRRMQRITVSWNWLEGLKSDFLMATGLALGDVPTGWSIARVKCLCFSRRPSIAGTTISTYNRFSSSHWRSFSAAGLCFEPGLYFSLMALLLMLAFLVRKMTGL